MSLICKQHKDYVPSLRGLLRKGGSYAKAQEKARYILSALQDNSIDTKKLNTTKHGETRIKQCIKYQLPGGCRVVTIQDNGIILFCYAGSHSDVDKWLDSHKGLTLAAINEKISTTNVSQDISLDELRTTGESALTDGALYSKIPADYFNTLMKEVIPSTVAELTRIESTNSEEEIYRIIQDIDDTNRQNVIYDTFCLLRQNKVNDSIDRIKLFTGENKEIKDLTKEEVISLANSDKIKDIPTDDPHYEQIFDYYIRNSDYMDWMLFLHPDQERLVHDNFTGTSKLIGVSGSGKTCVIVKRALRLAAKYHNEKILIITLNKSLARLINDLVTASSPPEQRENIEVEAFFELCQKHLYKLEPENIKLYDDRTWKSEEHIDEIWSEFYRCELNNNDAEVFIPIHDSLISRGIDSEEYIREELDWIRSAVVQQDRSDYLHIKREGRGYPLAKNFRSEILEGLNSWEQKMKDIGVTDYLGLSVALYKHIDKIQPKYRCILIDESQDFGTTELALIRKLAETNDNDLFFGGDAAQKISYKNQSFKKAGISIHSSRIHKIYKNYRNSKEILEFANNVLINNITEEIFDSEDFEFLDPEFADFHGSDPLVLKSNSLADEISSSLQFLKNQLGDSEQKKGCIAICGFSLFEIENYARELELPVLNGITKIKRNSIYLSDLEQTKGFEFDYVCIVNCNQSIIPNPVKPKREQIIDLARLYVTMTRAKIEIIISYSSTLSEYITSSDEYYISDTWGNYLESPIPNKFPIPTYVEDLKNNSDKKINTRQLSGKEFLYQKKSIGLSQSLIEKIRKKIRGRGLISNNRPVEWAKISEALSDLEKHPSVRNMFGKDAHDFKELFNKN